MSMMNRFSSPTERIVSRFTRYLNGPMGRTVMDVLDEGESFILQTSSVTLRVTKRQGKAVVNALEVPHS
ncbi:MAG: hypothetical protein AM324_006240 [Candidatus Thorarchaeota archaeon SMTZ1-83]|nr:MAG: hypothetical protein AM324_07375 [Candidatus Thorarchaeota archaeon SMTZ1-83]